MVGRTLAQYRIVEFVGRGGMGEVYRAEDTRLHRTVALKLLPPEKDGLDAARERLLREACAGSKLSHPCIATVYEVNEVEGRVFISMEFVDGESLARRLARGRLSLEEIVDIALQVADALEAAHREGVVHRDVKPANILIGADGQLKVVDFGLALEVRPPGESPTTAPTEAVRLTLSGSTVGTVAYMSPEQVGGGVQEFGSDIFSLGIVLYEMMTGLQPFQGLTQLAQAAAIMRDPPAPMGVAAAHLPSGLKAIVERCLRKEPAQRPTATQVREALLLLRGGHSTSRIRTVLVPRPWRTRAAVVAGLLTLAAAGAAGGYWLSQRGLTRPTLEFETAEARSSFEQARSYESRGPTPHDMALAEKMYRRALEFEPYHPLLRAHLARFLADYEFGYPGDAARRDEIQRLVDAALEAEPDLAPAWTALARLRLIEGDAAGAETAAQRAVRLEPDEQTGRVVLGDAWIELGRFEEGLAELRRAVALERGGHFGARARLAFQLFDHGRLDEAATEYLRLLDHVPDSPAALNNLGAIALSRGNYVEAIKHLKRLLEIKPDDYAASNLGMAYFYLDRMEEAIRAFHQAVSLSPDDPVMKQNLAEAYEKDGDAERASEWFSKALLNYDRDLVGVGEGMRAGLLAERGFCAAKLQRREQALANLAESSRLRPDDMSVLRSAARVHALLGQRDRAFAFLRRAVAAGYPTEELRRDPSFDAVRGDPEFLQLLIGD